MRSLLIAAAACLVLAAGLDARPGVTPRFRDAAEESGLHFRHVNGATGRYLLPEIMGAGGALLDFDGDGDLDVLLLQGRALDTASPPSATDSHRLFRNDLLPAGTGSALHFTDVTASAGLAPGDYGMGVAVGDYDNDGDADLYITSYGRNHLYRNDGLGRFTDVTSRSGAGLDDPRWSTTATFTDYDLDGDLDLFVANYVDFPATGSKACFDPTGLRDYCGPLQFRPVPDRLFRNNGDATFTDVSEASGIVAAFGSGLGVAGADLDGDGRPDFYVANDGRANQLWLNRGNGRFEEGALVAGVAVSIDGQPEGSMGLAVGDADNDGDLDLFVTNISGESHAFYENLGAGRFEDRRLGAGIRSATRAFTGFGTDWFDYDNDGRLDLFVANGGVTISEALRRDPFPFRQPSQLLRNIGGRFTDMSAGGGAIFQQPEVGRGAAFGDVDNDGDVDVLVTNNGGPARLLLNESAACGWLEIQLRGVTDNRQGLGARVGLLVRGQATVWRRAHTDGSYLSSSDPRVHFGVPDPTAVDGVVVEWPGGAREMWTDPGLNRIVSLRQGSGRRIPDGATTRPARPY